jgi:hypothetical protein
MNGETSSTEPSAATSDVALIFPPLVDTNFGSYFPSTAVLSAFLRAHGLEASQFDLNEELALYLLEPRRLEAAAEGRLVGGLRVQRSHIAAATARVLLRDSSQLFDAAGRHRFAHPGPGKMVAQLARPLLVDVPLAELLAGGEAARLLHEVYFPFFAATRIEERIAGSSSLVGISVPMGPQLAPALMLTRYLKQARPELRVIWGGPTLSLMNTDDLELLLRSCPELDAVVRFDGELPLLALAQQARSGDWSPASVPGVSCVRDGSVLHVSPAEGPRLAELPFADYAPELLQRLSDPSLGVVQARGCYWGRCSYCDFVELYDGSPRYRTKTVPDLVAEMAFQTQRHGVRRFALITESIPATFARKMAEELREREMSIRWSSFAMVDKRFTTEVFTAMAKSGCELLVIGMETMTDRVLKKVQKAGTQAENIRFLEAARDAGVRLYVNLIPDLPSTTFAEAREALDVFRRYADCITSAAVFPFEPTRSSNIGREPEKFGLIPVASLTRSGQAQYAGNHLGVVDPGMTDAERAEALALYRAFATEIQTANDPAGVPLASEIEHGGAAFRVPLESLDFSRSAEGIYCMNVLTREFLLLAPDWGPILDWLNAQRAVTFAELCAWLRDEELAREVLQQLSTSRLIVFVRAEEARATRRDIERANVA